MTSSIAFPIGMLGSTPSAKRGTSFSYDKFGASAPRLSLADAASQSGADGTVPKQPEQPASQGDVPQPEAPQAKQPAPQGGKKKKQKKPRRWVPVLCNIFGMILLLGVIGLCLPLTIPRIMGYEIYDVVSGSMEPEIPKGSVLYVKAVDPADIAEDEVIAFYDQDIVVAHRVVYNRTTLGEFVTKGDANNTEDLRPIPYEAVIGRVELNLPYVGEFMTIYASNVGKVYLVLTAACGLMLNLLATRLRVRNSALTKAQLQS